MRTRTGGFLISASYVVERVKFRPKAANDTIHDIKATPAVNAGPDPNPLTVVIVSYNCQGFIHACLTSVLEQTSEVDLRVVVVDNASTDATVRALDALASRITIVRNTKNVGFSRACNQGMAIADGGHVLILNPDTTLPAGALAAVLSELESRPHAGMLGCKLILENGEPDHACKRNFPTPSSSLLYMLRLDRVLGKRWTSRYSGGRDFDKAESVEAVSGAFMLVRRSALDDVGMFDERFWMYGEDLDWCMRFREHGWEVYYSPAVPVLHIKGGSSGRLRSLRVNWAFHEAMWIFYRKHQAANNRRIVAVAVLAGIGVRFLLTTTASAVARHGPTSLGRST